MVKFISILILMSTFSTGVFAQMPETLTISEGDKRSADRGRLTIKFVSVVEDSRCPPDVTCVWAGNAKVRFTVLKGKAAARSFELNTGLDPKSVKLHGYEIRLVSMTHRVPQQLMMHDKPLVVTLEVTRVK